MFGSIELPVPDYIKIINGRWSINHKTFEEMTLNERQLLAEKIKS